MPHERSWQMIADARRILMTTHVRPDADGLGCLAALQEACAGLGKHVRVVLPSAAGTKYDFLRGADRFEVLGRDVALDRLPTDCDLLLVIDTCTWQQLGDLGPVVRAYAGRILVVDHHQTRDNLDHVQLVDDAAAACSPLVLRMLEAGGADITPTMAEALFVSLAGDTGWFRFSNVTPDVFRVAARLEDLGAQPNVIYERLFQSASVARMRLLGEALSTLTVSPEGDVACFCITRDMFDRSGAEESETENLINETQTIAGVVISVLLIEQGAGQIHVSLRSKRDVDVAAVAASFGGGGHARAAGCTLDAPLAEARATVLDAVGKAVGRTVSGAE